MQFRIVKHRIVYELQAIYACTKFKSGSEVEKEDSPTKSCVRVLESMTGLFFMDGKVPRQIIDSTIGTCPMRIFCNRERWGI